MAYARKVLLHASNLWEMSLARNLLWSTSKINSCAPSLQFLTEEISESRVVHKNEELREWPYVIISTKRKFSNR
ncbi:hypothetical protein Bhyg_15293 [Pseudolycoriella hygida]|uniref:Uncharacterized protein n=1 Tax=Pseudolycoriella hygida TaxID=35572 RepID=A0A9Q0RWG2_9DIPT|nr:hypothetical protein Bhyg_15293 [Pseudolycoriella hygida]